MITVREATGNDNVAVAQVHVRSWQVAYRGLIADNYLDQLTVEERAARYTFGTSDASSPTTVVVVDDGRVLGFAIFGLAREVDPPDTGEIFALYVDPDFWRHGLGTTLITVASNRLRAKSISKVLLWVLEGNDRATRFYESQGWMADGLRRQIDVWGVTVNELRYSRLLTNGGQ